MADRKKWEWVTVPKLGQQMLVRKVHAAESLALAVQPVLTWFDGSPLSGVGEVRAMFGRLQQALDLFYGRELSGTAESSEFWRSDAAAEIWQEWEETVQRLCLAAGQVSDPQRPGSEERDAGVRAGESGDPGGGGATHLSQSGGAGPERDAGTGDQKGGRL